MRKVNYSHWGENPVLDFIAVFVNEILNAKCNTNTKVLLCVSSVSSESTHGSHGQISVPATYFTAPPQDKEGL